MKLYIIVYIIFFSDGEVDVPVLRNKRGHQLRHALSDVLPNEERRHSQSMTEAKEYAYNRLQQELNIAQTVSIHF